MSQWPELRAFAQVDRARDHEPGDACIDALPEDVAELLAASRD